MRGALGSGWTRAAREDGHPRADKATGVGGWGWGAGTAPSPAGGRLAVPDPSRQRWDLYGEGDGIRTQFSQTFPGGGNPNLRIRCREGIGNREHGEISYL